MIHFGAENTAESLKGAFLGAFTKDITATVRLGTEERLNRAFFETGRMDSLLEKTQYCIDDCEKCKNEDCLFGRMQPPKLS